jgi:hypothetical protein
MQNMQKTKPKEMRSIGKLLSIGVVTIGVFIYVLLIISRRPNYRPKHYCSLAESDAQNITAGITEYLSKPDHTDVTPAQLIAYESYYGGFENPWTFTRKGDEYVIQVTDHSGKCPVEYQKDHPEWNFGIYTRKIRKTNER